MYLPEHNFSNDSDYSIDSKLSVISVDVKESLETKRAWVETKYGEQMFFHHGKRNDSNDEESNKKDEDVSVAGSESEDDLSTAIVDSKVMLSHLKNTPGKGTNLRYIYVPGSNDPVFEDNYLYNLIEGFNKSVKNALTFAKENPESLRLKETKLRYGQ